MITFIISLISIALFGAILWLKPSHREQKQMQLRLLARKKGLIVRFTQTELPDKWNKSNTKVKVMSYILLRDRKITELLDDVNLYPYEVWKHPAISNKWYASKKISLTSDVAHILDANEKQFASLVMGAESVSLYWYEEDTAPEKIEEIYQLLTGIASIHTYK